MKLVNTRSDFEMVQVYIQTNPELMSGMTILLGTWNCNENNGAGELLDWDDEGQFKDENKFEFDFDEIIFLELMEAMEEMLASILIKVIQNKEFIQSTVAINGKPLPVDSFV